MEIMKDAKLSDLGEMLLGEEKKVAETPKIVGRTKRFEEQRVSEYAPLQGSWLYAVEG